MANKQEQISRLEATVMAMQDMADRFAQLASTAGQQLQELKTDGIPRPRKQTTDWAKYLDF